MNNQERIAFGKQWRDGSRQNLESSKLITLQNYENELYNIIYHLGKSSTTMDFITKFKKGEMNDLFNKMVLVLYENYPLQDIHGIMHNIKTTGLIALKDNKDAISIYANEEYLIIYNEITNEESKFVLSEIEATLK